MENVFEASIAGHPVRYAFHYPKTRLFFRSWLKPCIDAADVIARPEEIARAHAMMPEENAEDYAEFKALIGCTARYLLRFDCTIFHAVAFLWQGRAWLLTAPSGTGKTTQFMNWRKLNPAEITMISGDMPVLELRDNEVWVHPSPWNGKEAVGSFLSAPLGGVVLLEQDKENCMERLAPRSAIEKFFGQFTFDPETEEEILGLCRILDGILANTPTWKLSNKGDLASTKLLRETLSGGSYEEV